MPLLMAYQVGQVTDDHTGLKVLFEPVDAAEANIEYLHACNNFQCDNRCLIFRIVAIHGIEAHPDDTWCKNVGTKENLKWVNWLESGDMLMQVTPMHV